MKDKVNAKNIPFVMEKIDIHEFVSSLVAALEAKDSYTSGHSERVAELSERLAIEMGFDEERTFIVHISAHLHDIGKIGIRDSILHKPGKLEREEIIEIQRHSQIGYEILRKVKAFQGIALIVKHHHERFDGKGYPDGLKGEEIPIESRIITVADSFDAMVSPRPYRREMNIEEAMREISFHSGEQFDPEVATVIQRLYREEPEFLSKLVPVPLMKYESVKHENILHSRKMSV
jgi:HD-GYP domain-containing protein (c-di-GMP phosphodiesterase class II)